MIDIVKKAIPQTGLLWRNITGDLAALLEALSEEPKRIKTFLQSVVREANPGTAVDTQEEWHNQYNLVYDSTKTIEEQQAESLERFTALGGQDIEYLQRQLETAGFDNITISENKPSQSIKNNVCGIARTGVAVCWNGHGLGGDWPFYFFVIGTVTSDSELTRLKNLIQKIAPAHLTPIYDVTVTP